MSLPRDILDQLLSGYMDDALSNEERDRVEQLLRDDAEVARELEELRAIRSTLRQVHRADQSIKLDANFSDRVLKAAVDQATAEGLSDEHPVMMLAQQPSTRVAPIRSIPWAKIAGAVAAIAATAIIAVSVMPTANDVPDERGIAAIPQVDPQIDPQVDSLPDTPRDPGTQVVQLDPAIPTPVDADTDRKVVQNPSVDPNHVDPKNVEPNSVEPKIDVLDVFKGFVLVLSVRQSEDDAVANAMKLAGLEAVSEKRINEELVAVTDELTTEQDPPTVLYIGSSAKKIALFTDQLYTMYSNRDGIDSLGYSLVMDAPIVNAAGMLGKNNDPKQVNGDTCLKLKDGDGNVVKEFANELSEIEFMPAKNGPVVVGPPAPKKNVNDGRDTRSQIIVLVR